MAVPAAEKPAAAAPAVDVSKLKEGESVTINGEVLVKTPAGLVPKAKYDEMLATFMKMKA